MNTVDFSKHPKQAEFLNVVLGEVSRHNELERKKAVGEIPVEYIDPNAYRYLSYGGAIRGGKTYGVLAIVVLLASKVYKGLRAHVIRKSYPDLLRSTIPSLEKILKGADVRWNRSTANYFVEFPNGSRIYLISENIRQDPDLDSFKGLETNIIVYEQLEELDAKTWDKGLERLGSWYDVEPCIPPPLSFATFNPTHNWLKRKIYEPYLRGDLMAPFYYLPALPNDNPFVTAEQWRSWENLDEDSYNRFVRGSWDIRVEGQFVSAFREERNLRRGLRIDPGEELWLSFDFNVDPMTAIAFQTDRRTFFRVLKEWRIPDSDTYELCEKIREWIEEKKILSRIRVTGDASGANRISGARKHINQYEIIRTELRVSDHAFSLPTANPFIADSRTFVNSIFARFPEFVIDPEECPYLVEDIRFVLVGADASGDIAILKKGRNPYAGVDNSRLGHLLDCLRYGLHVNLSEFVKIPRS